MGCPMMNIVSLLLQRRERYISMASGHQLPLLLSCCTLTNPVEIVLSCLYNCPLAHIYKRMCGSFHLYERPSHSQHSHLTVKEEWTCRKNGTPLILKAPTLTMSLKLGIFISSNPWGITIVKCGFSTTL